MTKGRKHYLKSKEVKKLMLDVSDQLGINIKDYFKSKIRIQINEIQNGEIFIFNGEALLARFYGKLFPTLFFTEVLTIIPKIIIDMGAVPYVCKGADVMAPGITEINDEFNLNEIVLVVDERHGKPLAIGTALLNSEKMSKIKQGKVVKNLHYVGDKLWNHLKDS
jgi:PUA domain protein